jgi:hypothetical protein
MAQFRMKDKNIIRIARYLDYLIKTGYIKDKGILYNHKFYETPDELYFKLKEEYGEKK